MNEVPPNMQGRVPSTATIKAELTCPKCKQALMRLIHKINLVEVSNPMNIGQNQIGLDMKVAAAECLICGKYVGLDEFVKENMAKKKEIKIVK